MKQIELTQEQIKSLSFPFPECTLIKTMNKSENNLDHTYIISSNDPGFFFFLDATAYNLLLREYERMGVSRVITCRFKSDVSNFQIKTDSTDVIVLQPTYDQLSLSIQ